LKWSSTALSSRIEIFVFLGSDLATGPRFAGEKAKSSSSREPTIWVVDPSILIGYLRAGRYGEFLRREIARGGVFLPGVVLYELPAGATTRDDRTDVETLRRAPGQKIVETAADDWLLAGRCLARYAQRWEQGRPRDHLADAPVAVTAARLGATVAAEDVRGMTRWAWALRRLGAEIRVEKLTP
jgi:predicted nucleic acid-binding protein